MKWIWKPKIRKETKKQIKALYDMHLTDKGDAVVAVWMAFNNVTNWNRPPSENHFSFHVWEPVKSFPFSTSETSLPASTQENWDFTRVRVRVMELLSLASTTWQSKCLFNLHTLHKALRSKLSFIKMLWNYQKLYS